MRNYDIFFIHNVELLNNSLRRDFESWKQTAQKASNSFKDMSNKINSFLVEQRQNLEQRFPEREYVEFNPNVEKLPLIGYDWNSDFEFPTTNDLNKMPLDRSIKLSEIGFKKDDDGWLLGIQFKFTNGVESKFYQTKRASGNKF